MLWKMWNGSESQMLLIEANNIDDAFEKARDIDAHINTAQPYDCRFDNPYDKTEVIHA